MPRNKNFKNDRAVFTADTIKIAECGVLVTMWCCVNALGYPSFIFPIVNYRDRMMEGAPNGSLVMVTPSGWVSSYKNNPAVLVILTAFYTPMQSLNKITFTEAGLRMNGKTIVFPFREGS